MWRDLAIDYWLTNVTICFAIQGWQYNQDSGKGYVDTTWLGWG